MEPAGFSPRLAMAVESESLDIKCGNKYVVAHTLLITKIEQVARLLPKEEASETVKSIHHNLEGLKSVATEISKRLSEYRVLHPLPSTASSYSPRTQEIISRSNLFQLARKASCHEFDRYEKMAAIAKVLKIKPQVVSQDRLEKINAEVFILAQDSKDFLLEQFPMQHHPDGDSAWRYSGEIDKLAKAIDEPDHKTEITDVIDQVEEKTSVVPNISLALNLNRLTEQRDRSVLSLDEVSQKIQTCFTSRVLRGLEVPELPQAFDQAFSSCCNTQEQLIAKYDTLKKLITEKEDRSNFYKLFYSRASAQKFISDSHSALSRVARRAANIHQTVTRRKLAQLTPAKGYLYTPAIESLRACQETQKKILRLFEDLYELIKTDPQNKEALACKGQFPFQMQSYLNEMDLRTVPHLVTMSEAICSENNQEFQRRASQLIESSSDREEAIAILLKLDERLYRAESKLEKSLEIMENSGIAGSSSLQLVCRQKIGAYQVYELDQGIILTELVNSIGKIQKGKMEAQQK